MKKKVSNLLLMVEFLHGMLDDFKRFQPTLEKIEQLNKENGAIDRSNFHGRKRHEQIKREILELAEPIKQAITEPIKSKVAELNLCNWNDGTTLWNWNISDVEDFKREAQENDATLIVDNYQLYKEFKATPPPFYHGFFSELDEILNELYSYFIQEAKADAPGQMDLGQAIQEFKKTGCVRFTMPIEEQANDTPTTTVYQQIPEPWLKMFYHEFSEYLNFKNVTEFVQHTRNGKRLAPELFKDGTQTHFAYCFDLMLKNKTNITAKTKIMYALFKRKNGTEPPTRPDLVKQIEAFAKKI